MTRIKQIFILPVRIILTAYCFLQFAIQVLWLGKWHMPRLINQGGELLQQRRKALVSAHQHVTFYLKTLSFLKLVKFQTVGEPASTPGVVVANHPSLLDFIIFLRDYPHAICIYKPQSLENPVLSAFVQVAGYVKGVSAGEKGGNKRIIADCGERLEQGHHVVIFPEGSRSPAATTLHKFRTVAFHVAIKNNVAIQPVAIYCKPLFLGKRQSWKEFSRQRNIITLKYLPEIHWQDLPEEQQNAAGLSAATKKVIATALEEMTAG